MITLDGRSQLNVGLAQLKPEKAAIEANLTNIREIVKNHANIVDLLVFPETILSGYFLEGGVAEAARSAEEVSLGLGEPLTGSPDVVIGFYEKHQRKLYNSVGYFTPGNYGFEPTHIHRKMFIPTYGVFDEARFVEPGRNVSAFDTKIGRIGMLICEEMWHSLPATILSLDGAEIIIAVSASPARDLTPNNEGLPDNLLRWESLAPATATEHGVFVLVSQLVGSEGGKLFPGGSLAVGPDGGVLTRGPILEESITLASLDLLDIDRARAKSPLLADLEKTLPDLQESLSQSQKSKVTIAEIVDEPSTINVSRATPHPPITYDDMSVLDLDMHLVEKMLIEFIREEVMRSRGFKNVVIGLSGGVDSSVSLCLAVQALGPENVIGFRMPYATSSKESLDHAELVIKAYGAKSRTIDITETADSYINKYEPDTTPLRRGNIAARLRSVILFDQSAKLQALPLGTGNKSERLLGYYTWHADDSPPINPLGDLLKTQVWALAKHLGIPEIIVDKPASADLVKGVHDEDEIGIPYSRADLILHWLLKGYREDELKEYGFPENDVDRVWKLLSSTHWKRELPTVAMLSSSAIGEFYLRPVDY